MLLVDVGGNPSLSAIMCVSSKGRAPERRKCGSNPYYAWLRTRLIWKDTGNGEMQARTLRHTPEYGALDFLAKVAVLSRRRNGFETRMRYQFLRNR